MAKRIFEPDYRRTGYKEIKEQSRSIFTCATIFAVSGVCLLLGYAASAPKSLASSYMCFSITLGLGWYYLCMVAARKIVNRLAKSSSPAYEPPTDPTYNYVQNISLNMDLNSEDTDPYDNDPKEFEHLVARVFEKLCTAGGKPVKAQVVGGAGDQGIDIKLWDSSNMLVGIVQVKRYNPNKTLDPNHLRAFDSVRRRTGVRKAYLVTTARFGAATIAEARDIKINLIDGQLFKQLLNKANTSGSPSTFSYFSE